MFTLLKRTLQRMETSGPRKPVSISGPIPNQPLLLLVPGAHGFAPLPSRPLLWAWLAPPSPPRCTKYPPETRESCLTPLSPPPAPHRAPSSVSCTDLADPLTPPPPLSQLSEPLPSLLSVTHGCPATYSLPLLPFFQFFPPRIRNDLAQLRARPESVLSEDTPREERFACPPPLLVWQREAFDAGVFQSRS